MYWPKFQKYVIKVLTSQAAEQIEKSVRQLVAWGLQKSSTFSHR